MSCFSSDRTKTRSTTAAASRPKLGLAYRRVHSAAITPASSGKRGGPRNASAATTPPHGAANTDSPLRRQASAIKSCGSPGVRGTPLPPPGYGTRRSSTATSVPACWDTSLRGGSVRGSSTLLPLQRTASSAAADRRCKYVVATMKSCGSIYEEMTRQLLDTGRWSHVTVRQRAITKALYVAETQRDLTETNVHLLLGEKMPCERVISSRRATAKRRSSGFADAMNRRRASLAAMPYVSAGARMPMGNGDDGLARVVDFVENTRSITLKSSMVTNLLKYHHHNWNSLGAYLPKAFKLLPRQPHRDERSQLLGTALERTDSASSQGGMAACIWIAKSSSGCHGDNIEIFSGDNAGLTKLLRYVDTKREGHSWIAQQYIDRPLLYHKRKFDIRCWALLLRDPYEIYVHEELVMRTSSVPYSRDTATSKTANGRLAHITNHCVQEAGAAYSLFEEGNELWREHLDGLVQYNGTRMVEKRKLEKHSSGRSPRPISPHPNCVHNSATSSVSVRDSPYPLREAKRGDGSRSPHARSTSDAAGTVTLDNTVMPQIHFIIRDTLLAAKAHVPDEPALPPTHTFQILGYDFLIDEDLKVWLLEINGAPGGPDRLKPPIMKDTIELAVAPFFPGTMNLKAKRQNGYVCVYP